VLKHLLHLVCGSAGPGRTTYAREVSEHIGGVRFSMTRVLHSEGVHMRSANRHGRRRSASDRVLRPIFMMVTWAGLLTLLPSLPVEAKALAECALPSVAFHGITPLRFYRVTGAKEQRLYIHASYPGPCKPANHGCGNPKAYLVTGDTVAVGKLCGAWAYVQFIGQRFVTIGWIDRSRLAFLRKTSQVPVAPRTDDRTIYHFKLTSGEGRPVCEAYLQRLNSAPYPYPPYCNRPEDDEIPGFALLHRMALSPHEISYLSNRVMEFEGHVKQGATIIRNAALVRAGKAPIGMSESEVRSTLGEADLYVWRYEPPIDIDNDGTPDNLIVWRGVETSGSCGSFSPQGEWLRKLQRIYLLTPDSRNIEAARTADIFRRPGHDWEPYEPFQGVVIGDQFSPFEYREVYYFDVFFGSYGDLRGQGAYRSLGVFERRKAKTVQVCEYRMLGNGR
jgi:hypothetical protein